MNFNIITSKNIELLDKFIKKCNSKSFRYYQTRDVSVIKNHIITLILTDKIDNQIIGYGHLDFEGKIWLGIYVVEKFRGKGYSKIIMNYLIEFAKEKEIKFIYLTVDKDNIIAKKLYEKYGFFIQNDNNQYIKNQCNNKFYLMKLFI